MRCPGADLSQPAARSLQLAVLVEPDRDRRRYAECGRREHQKRPGARQGPQGCVGERRQVRKAPGDERVPVEQPARPEGETWGEHQGEDDQGQLLRRLGLAEAQAHGRLHGRDQGFGGKAAGGGEPHGAQADSVLGVARVHGNAAVQRGAVE